MISFSRRPNGHFENHAINFALFADSLLILFIIFIIAAPLAMVEVFADFPSSAVIPQPQPARPVSLRLKADLSLWIGDRRLPRQAVAPTLDAATNGNKDERIFLIADPGLPYADILNVLNSLRNAGYLKVALVQTEAGDAK